MYRVGIIGCGRPRSQQGATGYGMSHAHARGVRRILVTHPEAHFIQMPVAAQLELRDQGAYFERCYNSVTPTSGEGGMTIAELAAQIRQVGVASTVLSTDYGQADHPAPTVGLRSYLADLLALGFSRPELRRMAGDHPAALLGV